MRLKLTLQRPTGPVDIAATVDSAVTVGELARYLAAADPSRRDAVQDPESLTLGLEADHLALDPQQPVVDSGLRSGAAVTISRSGTTHSDPQRVAAAVLRVLDGPDAGQEFPLPRGAATIGRQRGCEVRLTDSLVSRRHARINVGDVIEVIDLGSANGVQVDGGAAPRAIVRAEEVVQVGDTRFTVRLLNVVAAADGAISTAHVRSPRIDPVYEGETFEVPELPERPGRGRIPVVALIAPVLVGALLFLITKSMTSIVFVALSPVMLLGNAIESRISGSAAYKRAVKDFRAEVDSLLVDRDAASVREVAARDGEHPSTTACIDAAHSRSPLLWTRRPGERAFGEVRLGLGRMPSRTQIELPHAKKSARALFTELATRIGPYTWVEPVPIVGSLQDAAIGVGGPRDLALPVARALLAQLVVLHSPAELVVATIASSRTAGDWDWLKWLPHTSALTSPLVGRPLVSSSTAGASLLSELEDLLAQRSQAGPAGAALSPAIVLLVEQDAPVEHSRLVHLAERGAEFGIHTVWIASEVALLPAACKTYVEVRREVTHGNVGLVHLATSVTPVRLDVATASQVGEMARLLCPVVDIGERRNDASDLPRAVSLLAINGAELAGSPDLVIERWSENRSLITGPFAPPTPPKHAGTLRAVLGEAAGEKLALDLRADGPHALVGGTTGSGKSELLQAWILAMASAHSPQRLTFLLVDYKGGSAFRDCVDLPHNVGLVTDLSPHLVRRALTSLSAELRFRERLLARHGAKDLVTLERQGVIEAPPSLVIVVDEFAALVNEVPEFVDGVVNVAQRGRSLGLHLILATQRPAGVIKDNLRANTNLRLALRMADEADSVDVLGSADAAYFDPALPGRAVSKTGPGRLVPFQTGYAGGWTTDDPPPPDIVVEVLTVGSAAVWDLPESPEIAPVDPGPTDIRRLVSSIGQASAMAQIAEPRRPWLPELASVYDLADRNLVPNNRLDTELVFGVRDDPDNQEQPVVAFYPDRDGNLAVYGTGGSGKSTLLRTLAVSAGFTFHGGPCHVYGIDFGTRGLSTLEELPHVGSIISGDDHERITRLLSWLRGLLDERATRYSKVNAATITDYRNLSGDSTEPRILLLVDGLAAFRQSYESSDRLRWYDMFTAIASGGPRIGVHVVLSSEQRGGLNAALASAVQSRVVLRQASSDDYGVLGVPDDVLRVGSPPGRGLIGTAELQVATLGGTADAVGQSMAIRAFAEAMRRSATDEAPPIGALAESVRLGDLPSAIDDEPTIGLRSSTLGPFGIEPRGSFLITGPPGSGRSTALITIAQSLQRWHPAMELYYFGSSRSLVGQLPVWTDRGLGSGAGDLAARLASELPLRAGSGPEVAIFIEGVADFANGLADGALQELAKFCLNEDQLLVAEGESSTLSSSFGLLGYVKSSRTGLALQPDQGDGAGLYRTNFPRINRAEFPPGRGLYVRMGKVDVVQVALPLDR